MRFKFQTHIFHIYIGQGIKDTIEHQLHFNYLPRKNREELEDILLWANNIETYPTLDEIKMWYIKFKGHNKYEDAPQLSPGITQASKGRYLIGWDNIVQFHMSFI